MHGLSFLEWLAHKPRLSDKIVLACISLVNLPDSPGSKDPTSRDGLLLDVHG